MTSFKIYMWYILVVSGYKKNSKIKILVIVSRQKNVKNALALQLFIYDHGPDHVYSSLILSKVNSKKKQPKKFLLFTLHNSRDMNRPDVTATKWIFNTSKN